MTASLIENKPPDLPEPAKKPEKIGKPTGQRKSGKFAFLLLLPALIIVFGVILYPLLRTVWLSFFNANTTMNSNFPFIGFENYQKLFNSPSFWSTVGRTATFTVFSTAIELVLGIALAIFLNQPLKGQWVFRTAVILVWAIPTIVNANLWRWILHPEYGALNGILTRLGWINHYHDWIGGPKQALYVVGLVDAWKTIPLVAILILAGLQTIPGDIYEAGAIDGAGVFRRFWNLTLPLIVPTIAIVLVLRTIEAFKVFDIIYIMTRGGPASGTTTIAFYTYLQAFSNQRFGYGSAVAVLTALFILLLSVVYLRILRRPGEQL